MSEDKVTGGATTVTSISKASIRVEEIQFLSIPGSSAVQLKNHVTNANVKTPEWERSISQRLIKLKSPYMSGPDVEKVQDSLVSLGYDIDSDDTKGVYGPGTDRAVKKFQEYHGLSHNGIVGPETRTFLGLQGAACYPINTQFVILVKFSAPSTVTSADIWAKDKRDGFSGLGSETDPTEPVTVDFSDGFSDFCKFKIITKPTKISICKTKWLWKCRNINEDGSKPANIGKTEHLIYTVYKIPEEPMKEPWIAVLHKACVWAANETDDIGAATKVTENVNSAKDVNGKRVFKYDTELGASFYSTAGAFTLGIIEERAGLFGCTEYLERLNGGYGNGEKVNCRDCASMVTTFANALGCKLFESMMGDISNPYMYLENPFQCNEIIAIGFGSREWEVPAKGQPSEGFFSYHEVAWSGSCGDDDELYDACLKVDGDRDPTTSPHTKLLPTNIKFHVPNETHYKERLVAEAGLIHCNPIPITMRRRTVV